MSEWQPIESAPKDRTSILLWYPWVGSEVPGHPQGAIYIARWFDPPDSAQGKWIDPANCEDIGEGATYWRPLPSPPAPQDIEAAR